MTKVEILLAAEVIESSVEGNTGSRTLLFTYDSDQPLSVVVRGRDNGRFEFDRDLLRDGLERTMAGYGDVRFLNHGLSVFLHNSTPAGYATYLFDRGDLRAFLRATQRLVEFGAEVIDFDAELDALLKDGAR